MTKSYDKNIPLNLMCLLQYQKLLLRNSKLFYIIYKTYHMDKKDKIIGSPFFFVKKTY